MNKIYKSKETEQRVVDARTRGIKKQKEKRLERISIYLKSPKRCLSCDKPIGYDRKRNNFCSSSCGATYNNRLRKKNFRVREAFCIFCGEKIVGKNATKYCSHLCSTEHHKQLTIKKYKEKYILGKMNDHDARRYFRRVNIRQCSICLRKDWNEKEIPLEVDHVDGNTNNNLPSNLRFVCRNCGAQLPTAGSKNKNSGRVDKRTKWYYELNKEKN